MHDTLTRFLFEHSNIRGHHVDLEATWQAGIERVDYPPVVREVLGQLMAASVLLSGTLKFEGSLKLELRGKGPITLVVAQATHDKSVRGLAQWEGAISEEGSLIDRMGHEGQLLITLESTDTYRRYQGIVGIERPTVAGVIEEYFERSEQLPTHLWLAADDRHANGLLLQCIPMKEDNPDTDAWNRIIHLASTLTEGELLDLPTEELLYRLFHDEAVRVFEPEYVNFRCHCSQEKSEATLYGLGRAEVQALLKQEGEVRVQCEFCGRSFRFDAIDIEGLFADNQPPQPPHTKH